MLKANASTATPVNIRPVQDLGKGKRHETDKGGERGQKAWFDKFFVGDTQCLNDIPLRQLSALKRFQNMNTISCSDWKYYDRNY